jgi:hypothetical protein
MAWQITHGLLRGAYLKVGASELYVRQASEKASNGTVQELGGWLAYVDGELIGAGPDEKVARAIAEAYVRQVLKAHASRVATAAKR